MSRDAVGEVVIAGAGIGGLTLACALRRGGIPVRVYERAQALGPVGAGITVQSNATRVLRRIGLDEGVRAGGAELVRAELHSAGGHVLGATDLRALAEEAGAPTIGIHRARLHEVLLQAAGEEIVHSGLAVEGYEQADGQVNVRLQDGSSVTASLLVGADGLRSRVRAQLVTKAGWCCWETRPIP